MCIYFFSYPVITVIRKQKMVAHAKNLCCFIMILLSFHFPCFAIAAVLQPLPPFSALFSLFFQQVCHAVQTDGDRRGVMQERRCRGRENAEYAHEYQERIE